MIFIILIILDMINIYVIFIIVRLKYICKINMYSIIGSICAKIMIFIFNMHCLIFKCSFKRKDVFFIMNCFKHGIQYSCIIPQYKHQMYCLSEILWACVLIIWIDKSKLFLMKTKKDSITALKS